MVGLKHSPWYFNPTARQWSTQMVSPSHETSAFHRANLPGPKNSPLTRLPDSIAQEFGVGAVYLKDESSRAGLPAFKVLGASWAIYRLLVEQLHLDASTTSLETIAAHFKGATGNPLELVTATDGNHGRAVADIATRLGLRARIYVPIDVSDASQRVIRDEGAEIILINGDYDSAIAAAAKACSDSDSTHRLLVQDTAFEGYSVIPSWIVDGYTTLSGEIDDQLTAEGRRADLIVVPVGVGSFAHSVVRHFRASGRSNPPAILIVEADAAPCLNVSLNAGHSTTIVTKSTVMAGLNCGTPSPLSWVDLYAGVDAATTVSDEQSLEAMRALEALGVDSGPCGAAPLAAVRASLGGPDGVHRRQQLGLEKQSTIVLISTEGGQTFREGEQSLEASVEISDVVSLAQALIRIESANPDLSAGDKARGESAIANYVSAWLAHRGFEAHRLEERKGRPSIVAVARGSGGEGAKSLMFNGHIDTVTLAGYKGDPLSGDIIDSNLHGRGASDMKAGIAAFLVAAVAAKEANLRGDIIVACVADEEFASGGTQEVLAAGWRADGAIIPEPTALEICTTHAGFVWADVDVIGVAAHGSRADLGIDAISKAGHFLVALEEYEHRLASSVGEHGSVHASLIRGGEEPSSYPANCTITIERRTIMGETPDSVKGELQSILDHLTKTVPSFKSELLMGMTRPPFHIAKDHPLVECTSRHAAKVIGREIPQTRALFWTDCALLADAGVPALLFGVDGVGAHAATEYATVESIKQIAQALTDIALEFCK